MLISTGFHQFRAEAHGDWSGFGIGKTISGGNDTGEVGGSFVFGDGVFTTVVLEQSSYHFGDRASGFVAPFYFAEFAWVACSDVDNNSVVHNATVLAEGGI